MSITSSEVSAPSRRDGAELAPHVCRVTIVAPDLNLDVTVPATVPLASILPSVVELVDEHRDAVRTATGADPAPNRGADSMSPRIPTLSTGTGVVLGAGRSLLESGVRDGDLLVLHERGSASPAPLFDDVVHAVSVLADRPSWTASCARWIGSTTAVAVSILGSVIIALRRPDDMLITISVAVIAAIVLAIAALLGSRRGDGPSAVTLALCSLPLAAAAGTGFVVGFGPADVALSSTLVAASAAVAIRTSGFGRSVFTALTVAFVVIAVGALVATLSAVPERSVGAVAAGACILLMSWAPRLSMMHARLTLPSVPVPGGADADDAQIVDHADPGVEASYASLRATTARAQEYLTGYVTGLSAAAAVGALVAATPSDGSLSIPLGATALVVSAVLMLRGRLFVDRVQAGAGVVSGISVTVGLLIGAAVSGSIDAPVLFGLCALVVVAALVFGSFVPGRSYTPIQRRLGEIVEFLAIASLVPLIAWAVGLFSSVRGL